LLNWNKLPTLLSNLNSSFYQLSPNLSKNTVLYTIWDKFILQSTFITTYYTRNENMWGDGFLFDFLQKKTADAWVRRFVIYTGFLFSERLVFDSVVRIYLDNLIWPGHHYSTFEANNVSEMLSIVIFLILTCFFILVTVTPFMY
jgi:hypothetical protein